MIKAISGKELLRRDLLKNKYVYMMAVPILLYYILFHYIPMYGAVIAFKEYSPGLGIWKSPWIGFQNFVDFFNSVYFWRILRNTLQLNVYLLIFGFPFPIILAILLNEIRYQPFKKFVQTTSYMPHFISVMVVCGMITDFTSSKGIINDLIVFFGGERSTLLLMPEMFRSVYVISDIWKDIGWNSIIYIAAIASIDQEQYEAAIIDGAGRLKKILHITLPGIMPTIVVLLILRMGQMMNIGFEKIILLYNPNTYETADVISSFVYRKGLLEFNYSFSTAVGLFNSLTNFALIITANFISRKLNETSLW